MPSVIIEVEGTDPPKQKYDAKSRTLTIENDDGSAVMLLDVDDPNRAKKTTDEDDFHRNLVDDITEGERQRIVTDLMEAVDADDRSRQDWLKTRAKGIEMLGFKLEEPRGDDGLSSSPLEGMSVVRHPLLPEAVIRFQANAASELYPPEGPVKVYNDSPPVPTGVLNPGSTDPMYGMTETQDDLSEALERDLNHYLTVTDKEYRADSVRMLFGVGFGGCGFKKVYYDPVKRRPMSRSVDAKDLIVSNDAVGLEDAGRVTHRVVMRRAMMKRMQLAGAYIEKDLGQPSYETNDVDRAVATAQGFDQEKQRQEDIPYTVDEIYCELDIKGFEHKEHGKITGLELPYKVSIERTSRTLLEVRRNWREDDETVQAKKVFVKFGFVPALGFYDIGLLHILGNATRALTAAWREMLDAGMFSVFPGILVSDAAGRQFSSKIRIPPGGAQVIKTGGQPISSVAAPLPYKEPSQAMLALIQHVEQMAQRIGGTAEMPVGEGRADAPVGTTLALIEQATKVLAGVHVGLHDSQAEELQLLKELFAEDPESFWRFNRRPSRDWEIDQFVEALRNHHIVPRSDPNLPTHLHRIMKAVAVKQLQAMNPSLYDAKAVDSRILKMIGFADPEELFASPEQQAAAAQQQAPMDPVKMAALKQKEEQSQREFGLKQETAQMQHEQRLRESQIKATLAQADSLDRQRDRESRERLGDQRVILEKMKLSGQEQQQGQQVQIDQYNRNQDRLHENLRGQQQLALDAHSRQLDHEARQVQGQQQMDLEQQKAQQQMQIEGQKANRQHALDMRDRVLDIAGKEDDRQHEREMQAQEREHQIDTQKQERADELDARKEESRHKNEDRKLKAKALAKKPAKPAATKK